MSKKTNKKEKYDPISELKGKDWAKREAFEWISTFAQALFGVVIVFTFLCRFVTVDGESMMNTLEHQDRLIISDVNYTPARGDIVVVHTPDDPQFSRGPVIKRIIATEGEKVRIDYKNRNIYITGKDGVERLLEEWYIEEVGCDTTWHIIQQKHPWSTPDSTNYPKVFELAEIPDEKLENANRGGLVAEEAIFTVGEGEVFVCGDNRAHSLDSRYVGPVDQRQILGKVLFRVFPNPSFMNHTDYEIKGDKLVAKK